MEDKLPERAKIAREDKGLKVVDAARHLGISRTTLWKYEKGLRTPNYDLVSIMAAVYEAPLDWLLGTTELREHTYSFLQGAPLPTRQNRGIPLLGTIPAGLDAPLFETIYHYVQVAEDYIGDAEYIYVQAAGDSLSGSRIYDGYLVMVRLQSAVEDGQIALVRTASLPAALKKVRLQEGSYHLYDDDPRSETCIVPVSEAQILGKVVKAEFDPQPPEQT